MYKSESHTVEIDYARIKVYHLLGYIFSAGSLMVNHFPSRKKKPNEKEKSL